MYIYMDYPDRHVVAYRDDFSAEEAIIQIAEKGYILFFK